jgi:hypothetical protein
VNREKPQWARQIPDVAEFPPDSTIKSDGKVRGERGQYIGVSWAKTKTPRIARITLIFEEFV